MRKSVFVANEGFEQSNNDEWNDEKRHKMHECHCGEAPRCGNRYVISVSDGHGSHHRPPERIVEILAFRYGENRRCTKEAEHIEDCEFSESIGRVDDPDDEPLGKVLCHGLAAVAGGVAGPGTAA